MSFDDIKQFGGRGEFLKIKAGDNIRVHVLDKEPETKYQHPIEGGLPKECTGAGCENCQAGIKRSARFSMPVFNLGSRRAQTLEGGIKMFLQILAIWEAYEKNLAAVDLLISRKGSGLNDTQYTVVSVPTQFKPEMLLDKKEEVHF